MTFSNKNLILTSSLNKNKSVELPQDYIISKFFSIGYFAQYNIGNNNYSCSCPICREGDTGIGNVKRCYYLPEQNIIYCHRCGWSSTPLKWIKTVEGLTNEQIIREIEENDYEYQSLDKDIGKFEHLQKIVSVLPTNSINLSDKTQLEYYKNTPAVKNVIEYIKTRRLDTAVNKTNWFTTLDDPIHQGRLIIPFYDEYNKIIHYQSRDITGKSSVKYFSKQGGVRSVFNINNLDFNKKNYFIFEGPLDSCFVKNGVAIAGINTGNSLFSGIQSNQINELFDMNRIWVLDSQYLDDVAYEKSEILLNKGEEVFIWPKSIGTKFKDFNELAMAVQRDEINEQFIIKNTFKGLEGILNLKKLKK